MKSTKTMLTACVGVVTTGVSLLACTAPTTSEHTTSAAEPWAVAYGDSEGWPIDADCTCPGGLDQSSADQCAFAQQYLQLLYRYGATWNGGDRLWQSPTPGAWGACANSSLPPLTATGPWGESGGMVQTPSFDVSDWAGFYDAEMALEWTSAPDGVGFWSQPVMFYFGGAPWANATNYGGFEPIKCSTCFAQ